MKKIRVEYCNILLLERSIFIIKNKDLWKKMCVLHDASM